MSWVNNKKTIKTTLLLIILVELLSLLPFYLKDFRVVINNFCFIAILGLTLFFSLKNLKYGLFVLITELVIGSFGYLFLFQSGNFQLSVRTGLFVVVLGSWLANVISTFFKGAGKLMCCSTEHQQVDKQANLFRWYAALALVVLWGFVWGLVRGNTFANAFLDFNNWLYFLIFLPLWTTLKQNYEVSESIKIIILTAVCWVAFKTLIVFYFFSHNITWALPEFYFWIRDTGVGEVTRYTGNIYRVFFQNQIYLLFAFFVIVGQALKTFLFGDKIGKFFYFGGGVSLAIVVLSLSRSLWLGLVAGVIFYFAVLLILHKTVKIKKTWLVFWPAVTRLFSLAVLASLLLAVVYYAPPKVSGDITSLLDNRLKIEAAGSSRLNLLQPLMLGIIQHPVVGSGFGATITYQSADPRIIASTAHGSGTYTTYAFEWGYLDMIFKFGLVGLAVYLGLLFKLARVLWRRGQENLAAANQDAGLYFGAFLSLLVLMVVNITTPYLNHPLGIGWVVLLSMLAMSERKSDLE